MKVIFEGVPNYVWNWLIGILIAHILFTGASIYLRNRTIKYTKMQIEYKKQELEIVKHEISEETKIQIKAIEMLDIMANKKKEETKHGK